MTRARPSRPTDSTSPADPAADCPGALAAAWDALTPEQMRRRGSLKWNHYPGDVIAAWVAEMDLGTAPVVGAALHRAVDDGLLGYMPTDLALRVRGAVAAHHREQLGWDVDAEAVSLLPDVLSALHSVIAHHTRPGSPVIVPTPAYMPFLSIPALHGRQCLQVPALRAAGAHGRPRWTLDLEAIGAAMADGAGLLVLCHPWNPVGRVLEAAELDAVAALSARHGTVVFADEIHSSLILDPAARHIPYASRLAADPDLTFTATAVSKGWNVPGLKCAQLIATGGARRAWRDQPHSARLADGAGVLGALAAVAALSEEGLAWNRAVRAYVRANGELVGGALAGVEGAGVTVPTGSYLAWLDFSGLDLPDGADPARWFLDEAGVAMSPGRAFGTGFDAFCRLNLATGRGIEEQTVERLRAALTRLRR